MGDAVEVRVEAKGLGGGGAGPGLRNAWEYWDTGLAEVI